MELVSIIGLFFILTLSYHLVKAENIILGLKDQIDELIDALEEARKR